LNFTAREAKEERRFNAKEEGRTEFQRRDAKAAEVSWFTLGGVTC
jgi:hypothetical protein